MGFLWFVSILAALATALANPEIGGLPLRLPALALAGVAAFAWLRRVLARPSAPRKTRPRVLIDGSNVMHWKDGIPNIAVVRGVAQALTAHGHEVGVIFDANVGYKLSDRYMNEKVLAEQLGLRAKQVLVSPRGETADSFLLRAARDMAAPIVSNDRFRDWQADFPEIATPGRLIHGGYHDGAPYLRPGEAKPG